MEIGWTELLVIGIVALIVIGPKDLPEMFRTLGRFTAKARSMAREFQRAMEAAADETGVKDIASDLKTVASPKSMGLDAVKTAADKFEKWDPLKNAARPTAPPRPPAAAAAAAAAAPVADAAAVADAATAAPAPALGPATQALADAQAARKAIAADAAEKLRTATVPPAGDAPAKEA
jgi:sec-independent protein translocase protein TatB